MKQKNVLVIGSGGREHALAWKLAQSFHVKRVYVAPGNGGTMLDGRIYPITNIPISATDIHDLLAFAKEKQIDLTVVGPEKSLELGIVDLFKVNNLPIFGPSRTAARLETSKCYAKQFMEKYGIFTAPFEIFSTFSAAWRYVRSQSLPIIIKANGLCDGKGVFVCHGYFSARQTLYALMIEKRFGHAGEIVLVEKALKGPEVSIHALSDGDNFILCPPVMDYKQLLDGNQGPNTGGMGGLSPVGWLSNEFMFHVKHSVISPVLEGMKQEGSPYVGCLYPGLMRRYVLEFNARFGDPEAEILVLLLTSDMYELLESCVHGGVNQLNVSWSSDHVVNVVLCSEGYPEQPGLDKPIIGLPNQQQSDDIVMFHAGTAYSDSILRTSGGRVLHITARGKTLSEARHKAYRFISERRVYFEGMHYRRDIAA